MAAVLSVAVTGDLQSQRVTSAAAAAGVHCSLWEKKGAFLCLQAARQQGSIWRQNYFSPLWSECSSGPHSRAHADTHIKLDCVAGTFHVHHPLIYVREAPLSCPSQLSKHTHCLFFQHTHIPVSGDNPQCHGNRSPGGPESPYIGTAME